MKKVYKHIIVFLIIFISGCTVGYGQPIQIELVTATYAPIDFQIQQGERYISMYNTSTQKCERVSLSEYLLGTLAAEMPALYEIEALKAQAVTAMTWLCYSMEHGGCKQHPDADICDSYAHCQEYMTPQERADRWGTNTQKYTQKLQSAISGTMNLVIMYDGRPIQAFYHSLSGGKTEDSLPVFRVTRPYLVSVDSPNEQTIRELYHTEEYTQQQLCSLLNSKINSANLTRDRLRDELYICEYTATGRVAFVQVGDVKVAGTVFRYALQLNSTNFKIDFESDKVIITTIGKGHGVGMSQTGANAMAKAGYNYIDIIKHYYTGVSIENYFEQ